MREGRRDEICGGDEKEELWGCMCQFLIEKFQEAEISESTI